MNFFKISNKYIYEDYYQENILCCEDNYWQKESEPISRFS